MEVTDVLFLLTVVISDMLKCAKLYSLNMFSLLYFNYTSIKLQRKVLPEPLDPFFMFCEDFHDPLHSLR